MAESTIADGKVIADSTIADGKIVTESTGSLWHGQQWIEAQLVELKEGTPIATRAKHGIDTYDMSNKRLNKRFEFRAQATTPLDDYYTHVAEPIVNDFGGETSYHLKKITCKMGDGSINSIRSLFDESYDEGSNILLNLQINEDETTELGQVLILQFTFTTKQGKCCLKCSRNEKGKYHEAVAKTLEYLEEGNAYFQNLMHDRPDLHLRTIDVNLNKEPSSKYTSCFLSFETVFSGMCTTHPIAIIPGIFPNPGYELKKMELVERRIITEIPGEDFINDLNRIGEPKFNILLDQFIRKCDTDDQKTMECSSDSSQAIKLGKRSRSPELHDDENSVSRNDTPTKLHKLEISRSHGDLSLC